MKMNKNAKFKILYVFIIIISFPSHVFSQTISVDVADVIRTIPPHAVGINMNYLMDGTYISSNTQSATTNTLKDMGMKFLRYPGGEKSDNYLWAKSPYSHSAPSMALTGRCQFPSGDSRFVNTDFITAKSIVLDFDEFVSVYKQVGAEPMIVCAYDAAYYGKSVGAPLANPCGTKPALSTLVTNAKEWVKYANVTKRYNIKYWCIGNESWNLCDYNGCVAASKYATDIVTFAAAMKSVDPTIKIIVNGQGTAWWQTLLESSAAKYIDYLGVSCYPLYNYTGGYDTYRTTTPNLLGEAQTAVNAINTYASAADKSRIKVISTEFNSIDFGNGWNNANDVGHSLVAFEIMGQHLKNPQVDAALFWNTRWITNTTSAQNIYDALDKNSNMNASGLALSIWGNNLLPELINATSTGTGNNFIKVFSDYDNVTNKLNIFVINKDNISRTINLDISNYFSRPFYQRYQYNGTNDADKFPNYSLLDLAPVQIIGYPTTFTLPKNSITLLKFGTSGTLASHFISLNARLNEQQVNLTWKSVSDNCGSDYAVERSEDGMKWKNAGNLKASCNGNNEYHFEEGIKNITATNIYYRIEEIDKEGYSFYSDVKTVRLNIKNESVKLFSNPVSGGIELIIKNVINKKGDIIIRDPANNIVKKFLSVQLDDHSKFNVQELPKGIYFLEIVSSSSKNTIKMIKL